MQLREYEHLGEGEAWPNAKDECAMSDFSVSFGPKSVTIEATYGVLARWLWKLLLLTALAIGLMTLTGDTPLPCHSLSGRLQRICEVLR